MSLAKIKEAAAASKDEYVTVRANDLDAALKEAGDKGDLAAHVAEKLAKKPDAVMSVHREHHLGKLLGVPALPLET